MIKRFISLLLVALLVSCTIITVHANPAVDWFIFCYDLGKRWYNNTYGDVEQMSGDEFYDFYNQKNPDARSVFYRAYDFAVSSLYSRDQYGRLGTPKTITDMNGAMYDRLLLNDYLLDKLDEAAISGYTSDLRFSTLDDIHLATDMPISVDNIKVHSGTYSVKNFGSSFSPSKSYDSWYDLTDAISDSDHVSIYRGGSMPPAIFIPSGAVVYQDGIRLSSTNCLYIVLGDNCLIQCPSFSLFGFMYYNPGSTVEDIKFGISKLKLDSAGTSFITNSTPYYQQGIYESGSKIATVNTSDYPGWVVLDLFEKMVGYYLKIDNFNDDFGSNLPEDIPYDDDGAVVVLIPQDNRKYSQWQS